jgi:hypothetical protein
VCTEFEAVWSGLTYHWAIRRHAMLSLSGYRAQRGPRGIAAQITAYVRHMCGRRAPSHIRNRHPAVVLLKAQMVSQGFRSRQLCECTGLRLWQGNTQVPAIQVKQVLVHQDHRSMCQRELGYAGALRRSKRVRQLRTVARLHKSRSLSQVEEVGESAIR